jgi:hypothetical protein
VAGVAGLAVWSVIIKAIGEACTRDIISRDISDEDGFEVAFADVPALTERGRARDAEIQEDVNADMVVEQQAMMAHRQAVGDAVGHNGDLLFVHRPGPGIRTNHGENSTLSRE